MRTSIITAVGHDGKGVLISGKEVGLLKNLETFKDFRRIAVMDGAHENYSSVSHQENDGPEQLLNFRTPDAQKKHAEARAAEKKVHAEALEAQAKMEANPRAEIDADAQKKRDEEHAADLAAKPKAAAPKGYNKKGEPIQ